MKVNLFYSAPQREGDPDGPETQRWNISFKSFHAFIYNKFLLFVNNSFTFRKIFYKNGGVFRIRKLPYNFILKIFFNSPSKSLLKYISNFINYTLPYTTCQSKLICIGSQCPGNNTCVATHNETFLHISNRYQDLKNHINNNIDAKDKIKRIDHWKNHSSLLKKQKNFLIDLIII